MELFDWCALLMNDQVGEVCFPVRNWPVFCLGPLKPGNQNCVVAKQGSGAVGQGGEACCSLCQIWLKTPVFREVPPFWPHVGLKTLTSLVFCLTLHLSCPSPKPSEAPGASDPWAPLRSCSTVYCVLYCPPFPTGIIRKIKLKFKLATI